MYCCQLKNIVYIFVDMLIKDSMDQCLGTPRVGHAFYAGSNIHYPIVKSDYLFC
ncbi:Uncharacterised protein [Klebsiella pneumoniae]|nr:Uncharacterised protein [Klebsiella pneumoniae]